MVLILLLFLLLSLLHPRTSETRPSYFFSLCVFCSVSWNLRVVAGIGKKPNFFPGPRFGLHYLIALHPSSPSSSSPIFFA